MRRMFIFAEINEWNVNKSGNSSLQLPAEGGIQRGFDKGIEYRAVSCVFQNIDPHPPLYPASVSSPATKAGVHTGRAERGWGVNILEDARHRIGLLQ
jgi:hypothetical protein